MIITALIPPTFGSSFKDRRLLSLTITPAAHLMEVGPKTMHWTSPLAGLLFEFTHLGMTLAVGDGWRRECRRRLDPPRLSLNTKLSFVIPKKEEKNPENIQNTQKKKKKVRGWNSLCAL